MCKRYKGRNRNGGLVSMPERKHKLLRKVDASEVQGEGAWVLLRAPTLEDIRGGILPTSDNTEAQMDFGIKIIGRLVQDWNWVDDNGDPLPKPSPEVVAGLPYAEIQFLMEAVELGKLANQKN